MINPFEYVLPTKIRYGAGMLKVLGEELRLLKAKKVMIITDKGLVNAGMIKKAAEIIEAEDIDFIVYDEIEANPKDYNVEACAEKARAESVDTLLAFGGGSPIDAAKATAVLARQGGKVRDYQGKGRIKDDCLPLITIPTTAGTGSEVTFSSVITDTKEKFKFTIKSTAIAAKTAIIDPELTLSVPPLITAATGIDALTHAIEGYTANCTEPIAEAAGLYAVEYIAGNIEEAVKNGRNIAARDKMMIGSLLAGLSFSHADVASVHCMAEALGSMYDAPHGMCNAILLPYVMEYNLPAAGHKYARVARAMGIEEKDDYTAAVKGIEHIRKLSKEIGLPGIRSLNVNTDDFELLAEMSEKNGSNDSNPRKISKDEYVKLFYKAYNDCN
ncbi:MAG TPA: iron-containing alcohol dehydrogenase [Bacillota bacterium]|nr:iron-containing alcohol dehydrogenase [Bacillota bacterium]HNT02532.1 iron-containing alcohol dehydrogenase [Bacillota bacterium]HPX70086.1 iron-containing alcohol dehydrogenase [Bacillota bacterium]HQA65767.1 iron-containing alcohol dehydrogenase [Bacillota bacterium]HQO41505.1 iron-containing alcohol dehydrogenase [Bacillota bacterium]